jgi:hypothetical protein
VATGHGPKPNRLVTVGGLTLDATVLPTNGWFSLEPQRIGAVQLPAGPTTLTIRATQVRLALMNVTAVHLVHTVEPEGLRTPATDPASK